VLWSRWKHSGGIFFIVASSVGRTGEFLAAFVLETYGVEVHHVDRAGADLWCKVRGSIVPVEVKSASRPRGAGENRILRYQFTIGNQKPLWFCFVALDRKLVLMRPGSEVLTKTVRVHPEVFTEAEQRRTIEDFLNSC